MTGCWVVSITRVATVDNGFETEAEGRESEAWDNVNAGEFGVFFWGEICCMAAENDRTLIGSSSESESSGTGTLCAISKDSSSVLRRWVTEGPVGAGGAPLRLRGGPWMICEGWSVDGFVSARIFETPLGLVFVAETANVDDIFR